jgi:hypothetical protein
MALRKDRCWRNLSVVSTSAIWCTPPVHRTNSEGGAQNRTQPFLGLTAPGGPIARRPPRAIHDRCGLKWAFKWDRQFSPRAFLIIDEVFSPLLSFCSSSGLIQASSSSKEPGSLIPCPTAGVLAEFSRGCRARLERIPERLHFRQMPRESSLICGCSVWQQSRGCSAPGHRRG